MFASFGHLSGYSSAYYTYMWSLVIAKDLFSAFDPADLFAPGSPPATATGSSRPAAPATPPTWSPTSWAAVLLRRVRRLAGAVGRAGFGCWQPNPAGHARPAPACPAGSGCQQPEPA